MKLFSTLLLASIALAQNAASAQAPAPAKPHPATHTAAAAPHATPAAHGCSKLPELSPKIPALPAGTPCAKPLYTIVTTPGVKLTDVSPLETPDLGENLGVPPPATITLSYIDSKAGTGELAAPRKWYSMKYHGYLVDGTEFDASDKHPEQGPTFTFQQGPQGPQGQRQVIVGWDTGLDGMRVGGKRRLFVPFQLAYGPAAHGQIPPKSWLIFDVELVGLSDTPPAPKTPPTPPAAAVPAEPAPAAKPATAEPAPATPAATQPAPATTSQPAPTAAPPATAPAAAPPKPQ
jgi:peptidylprolyl isomerase